MAHDLESNFAASSEVLESTVDRNGKPYSERMRVVVAKAALSKARRDATFQVVPAALCKTLEEEARKTAIGTAATLGKRRTILVDWLNKIGIDQSRVWASLGINGIDDVGLPELETLTGIKTALKDGDITNDEAFPPLQTEDDGKKGASALANKLKKQVQKAENKDKPEEPATVTDTKPSPEDAEKAAVLEKVEKLKQYKAMTVKKYLQEASVESLKDLGLDALNELHGQLTSA
jgi:hypothetical protein